MTNTTTTARDTMGDEGVVVYTPGAPDAQVEPRRLVACGFDVAREARAAMKAAGSTWRVEEFWAVALDARHRVLGVVMISRGCATGVEVHPRDTFRSLLIEHPRAVAWAAAHNHPSGDPTPSRQDMDLTKRLLAGGELLGMDMIDHVVFTEAGHVSIREQATDAAWTLWKKGGAAV